MILKFKNLQLTIVMGTGDEDALQLQFNPIVITVDVLRHCTCYSELTLHGVLIII